jgi:hypothetical protein
MPRLIRDLTFARSTFAALLTASLALGNTGCGGMGKGEESVSLVPGGVNASIKLPTGGKVKAQRDGGAEVVWAGFSFIASFALDKVRIATKRDAVAPDNFGSFEGKEPVNVDGKGYTCVARAKTQADAERVMAACDALAAASPVTKVAATGAAPAAPIELEDRTFSVKPFGGKAFDVRARVPKGWSTTDQLGTTLVRDPSPMSPTAISLTFGPGLDSVKSLAAAEGEARKLDTAGLDTIDDKRELGPGKLLVATAPRGVLKLTTVRVFVRGKKGSALATCSGPAARKSDLEQICSSVAVD